MISAQSPSNEDYRLQKLAELGILDTLEEQAYDDLTHLAAEICSAPIALISLIDKDRQWFKSHHGLETRETPREAAFCAHAILQDDVFTIEDSLIDNRFRDNPLVTGAPHVRFYAGAPLIVEDGVNLGTLCVIDHEPRVLTPAQIKSLGALARQVVSLLDLRLKISELEILDRAKNEFVAMVNHELRTPLSSVFGALQLLERDARLEVDKRSELIEVARRNTERLLVIVNDILDISKMEAGKLNINLVDIDLVGILKDSVALNETYINKLGCELTLSIPEGDEPVMVNVDEQRIIQVMYNLLSNAAKFSEPGSNIDIRLRVNSGYAQVSVEDQGCGIEASNMNKLFAKFQQFGGTETNKHSGTGLGLSICRHLLQLHNSKIECQSTIGVGSTFQFKLPLQVNLS